MHTLPGTDPTRVPGRRLGAFVIDWVLLVLVVPVLIVVAVSQPTVYTDGPTCPQLEQAGLVGSGDACVEVTDDAFAGTYVVPASGFVVAGLFLAAYVVGVLWVVQGLTGRTVGKLLFGLRTVDRAGSSPGLGRQLVRGVLWPIDAINCVIPLGALFILLTRRHQRIGDLAAATFVVRSTASGAPLPAWTPPPAGPVPAAAPFPAGGAPSAPAPPVGSATYPAGPPLAPTAAPATAPATPDPTQVVGFAAPDPDATTVTAPVTGTDPTEVVAATSPAGGPQWDPARNAYIQWDPARRTWLAYDDAAGVWKAIS